MTKSRARRKRIETTVAVMQVDHMPGRFLFAALKGVEVCVADLDDLLAQRQLTSAPQEIYSGRFDEAQARERTGLADRDSETHLTSVRMSNEVHTPAGLPAGCLDDFGFPLDR